MNHSVFPSGSSIAGFLVGFSGTTLISSTTDVRMFDLRRAHLGVFGRTMEATARMRSIVVRRLPTLASFYRCCHVEGMRERNPAANVRRPKVDPASRTLGLGRNELVGLLVQPGSAVRGVTQQRTLRRSQADHADTARLRRLSGARSKRGSNSV